MEPWNSPDHEKVSPSQESIAHPQNTKRDYESLEDFKDIIKTDPSAKELTAQFLQYELGNRNMSDEFVYQPHCEFHFDQKTAQPEEINSGTILSDQTPLEFEKPELAESSERLKHTDHQDSFNELYNFDQKTAQEPKEINSGITSLDQTPKEFEEPEFADSSEQLKLTDRQDSFNKLYNFDQSGSQTKNENVSEQITGKPILNILDENKLIDVDSNDEISVGSDDLSFIPKKGESSPVLYSEIEKDISKKLPSECRSSETKDLTFNSQPLSKFTSEPGVNREQEPEKLLGDGLHVKEAFEADVSDNDDDFVPEPIPKDYPEISAMEGKHILNAIGLGAWFHVDALHPKVESLIYWRDPKKSGIVFGAVMIILLSLTLFSLISVVAYTSLIALVSALAFRIYKSVMQAVQKTSEGHPFKKYFVAVLDHPIMTTVFSTIEEYLDIDLTVNPEKAREISDVVVSHVNGALTELRRLFLVEDAIDSVKFGVLLWCLTYVGAWFNGLSLLIIAFVGLFTLPKVYENNKTQIDANIDVVRTKINEVTEKITAVIPLGKKTEVKDKSE